MVQVTYSMPTTVLNTIYTRYCGVINPRATPSGLLAQYLVYMVYTPGRHGITTTYCPRTAIYYIPPWYGILAVPLIRPRSGSTIITTPHYSISIALQGEYTFSIHVILNY